MQNPDTCRYCAGKTEHVATLSLPVPNKYFSTREAARAAEKRPHILVRCGACGSFSLADTPFTPDELFAGDYAFAPVGTSWRNHCVELARALKAELPVNAPNERGVICDIGGNDGALASILPAICDRLAIVIDPSDVAPFQNGVHYPKRKGFFGEAFARELLANGDRQADGVTATNVLAHVPDPLDFMRGVKTILAPDGVAVFEFPTGEAFGDKVLFDLTYAEHIGYITLPGVIALAERAELVPHSVEHIDTHGGSWRVMLKHRTTAGRLPHFVAQPGKDFTEVMARKLLGLYDKAKGKKLIGFGSAAKSVVVNACFADNSSAVPLFIIDETPMKVGKFQPGSGAKILPLPKTYFEAMSDEEKLAHELLCGADVCINYAWNYPDEVREKLTRAGFRGEIVTVHDF
jgi:SAM-dependent methyltransferase